MRRVALRTSGKAMGVAGVVLLGALTTPVSLTTAARAQQAPRAPAHHNPAWAPDGARLMYEMDGAGKYALFTVRANGSANQPLSDFKANDTNGSWSPDGTRIVFVSDRDGGQLDVYIANADWSSPVNVSRDPGQQYQPAWSQDGRFIAYVTKPTPAGRLHDIVIVDVAAGTRRTIERPETNELSPSFSPDGTRIAFASNRTGRSEIYTMAVDGTDEKALTVDSGSGMPRWSRQGRIAFRSDRDGNSEIYTMNADGTDVVRVTNSPAQDLMPAWSPDGTRLAYVSNSDGRWRMHVSTATGGSIVCVQGDCNKTHEGGPSFSPDGRHLLFVTHRRDIMASDLFVVGVDGSGLRQVTTSSTPKTNASWSPDGTSIVFATREGAVNALWIVDVASGVERRLSGEASDQSPAFSPDGSEIVFGSGARGNVNLYTMHRDGSARRQLTAFSAPTLNFWPSWAGDRIVFSSSQAGAPGLRILQMPAAGGDATPIATAAQGSQCPALSRDGRRLAFQGRAETGNTDIFVIDVDGTGERRLTIDPGLDETPAWSPDGKRIAFQSDRSGEMRIYVMNTDGSNVRSVTRSR